MAIASASVKGARHLGNTQWKLGLVILLGCLVSWTSSLEFGFVEEPSDQPILAGEFRAVFRCRVKMAHRLVDRSVLWLRNGSPLSRQSSDNASLTVTIEAHSTKNDDRYQCLADYGPLGKIASRSARIVVTGMYLVHSERLSCCARQELLKTTTSCHWKSLFCVQAIAANTFLLFRYSSRVLFSLASFTEEMSLIRFPKLFS